MESSKKLSKGAASGAQGGGEGGLARVLAEDGRVLVIFRSLDFHQDPAFTLYLWLP